MTRRERLEHKIEKRKVGGFYYVDFTEASE